MLDARSSRLHNVLMLTWSTTWKFDGLKDHQAMTAAELDALLPSILDKAFKEEL